MYKIICYSVAFKKENCGGDFLLYFTNFQFYFEVIHLLLACSPHFKNIKFIHSFFSITYQIMEIISTGIYDPPSPSPLHDSIVFYVRQNTKHITFILLYNSHTSFSLFSVICCLSFLMTERLNYKIYDEYRNYTHKLQHSGVKNHLSWDIWSKTQISLYGISIKKNIRKFKNSQFLFS